jgi:hypothetical protein
MLASTTQIIRSALQADPSLNPRDRAQVLASLREKSKNPKSDAVPAAPRLIRRAEAARRLGYSLRMVDRLSQEGVLQKRKLPNRKRASGFLESDINTLLVGTEKEAA